MAGSRAVGVGQVWQLPATVSSSCYHSACVLTLKSPRSPFTAGSKLIEGG
ncbi:hypothetical protein C2845_PM01G46350 [Panicum miliaceum]|uniref:Uncharacterized protein n=1 Tax=Panicum miliaceum TaxID=4540 RepID=A0A3L6TE41_PANMI|nr:hypothetical protein C2845_PM01G46350 [Panicum miliaceum]